MFLTSPSLFRTWILNILMGKFCVFAASYEIVTISSIKDAKKYVRHADKNTLMLFDIDSTLTTPSDPYWQRQAIQRHQQIYQQYVSVLTQNQMRILSHLIVLQSPSQLVEKAWPLFIRSLQRRGIKTLALTASKTGAVGSIVSFPDWRYQELYRLGIDFSSTFSGSQLFTNLEDFGEDHPGIEKGIIYAGHKVKKGDLLQDIFKILNWQPATLIVVDDKLNNLVSCMTTLRKNFPAIKFIGIHYKGMEKIMPHPTNAAVFKAKIQALVQQTKQICAQ